MRVAVLVVVAALIPSPFRRNNPPTHRSTRTRASPTPRARTTTSISTGPARAFPIFWWFAASASLWVTVDAPAFARALHVTSASITLAGRNVHTWTGYSGIPPEPYAAEAQVGDPESFTEPLMPALQQWSLRLRVSY
jgi:hypothetical protein